MSVRSPESGIPRPRSLHNERMSRRRFVGKAMIGTGAAITLASIGYSAEEGRQTHLDEDFQSVTKVEAQKMHAEDKRHWRRFRIGAIAAVGGLITLASGGAIYDSGTQKTNQLPNTLSNKPKTNHQPSR